MGRPRSCVGPNPRAGRHRTALLRRHDCRCWRSSLRWGRSRPAAHRRSHFLRQRFFHGWNPGPYFRVQYRPLVARLRILDVRHRGYHPAFVLRSSFFVLRSSFAGAAGSFSSSSRLAQRFSSVIAFSTTSQFGSSELCSPRALPASIDGPTASIRGPCSPCV